MVVTLIAVDIIRLKFCSHDYLQHYCWHKNYIILSFFFIFIFVCLIKTIKKFAYFATLCVTILCGCLATIIFYCIVKYVKHDQLGKLIKEPTFYDYN